jgi:hypothetical protein
MNQNLNPILDGWRQLGDNEVIKEGDRFSTCNSSVWELSMSGLSEFKKEKIVLLK